MRRLLIILAVATTSIVLIALLGPMAVLIQRFPTEDALAAASLEVQAIETVVVFQDRADLVMSLRALNAHERRVRLTVLFPDGDAIGPDKQVTDAVLRARDSGRTVSTTTEDGVEVLVPVVQSESNDDPVRPGEFAVIRVVTTGDRINQQVFTAWAVLAGLGVGLLAVAALVANRLARQLTRPVLDLAEVAGRIGRGDLHAQVDPSGPPELQEVGRALNQLAGRITELLAAERESVADVSHRLRTPLAVLRLEAGELRDPDERQRAVTAVDALSRALDDVIRQARRPIREGVRAACDARSVVADRTGFWAALAEDQGRRMRTVLPDRPVLVKVAADDLAAAVDALLENVLSHTPDGTDFEVLLTARPTGGAVLVVEDRGPGFPDGPEALTRGASGQGSTGLGLDIARSTAEASGGRLRIARGPRAGGCVRLELGGVDGAAQPDPSPRVPASGGRPAARRP